MEVAHVLLKYIAPWFRACQRFVPSRKPRTSMYGTARRPDFRGFTSGARPIHTTRRRPGPGAERTSARASQPARTGEPDRICPNLVSWVKPLFDEYPQQDLMRVELGRLATMEIPLFADQSFRPFFHKATQR
jgi:hypothetical protein